MQSLLCLHCVRTTRRSRVLAPEPLPGAASKPEGLSRSPAGAQTPFRKLCHVSPVVVHAVRATHLWGQQETFAHCFGPWCYPPALAVSQMTREQNLRGRTKAHCALSILQPCTCVHPSCTLPCLTPGGIYAIIC